MKKTIINAYQVGLVFRNGTYVRLLKEGAYWLWFNETVTVYETTQPFITNVELNILLKDDTLAEMLHVVDVKEQEIVLLYRNGLLDQVLTAGRYAFWKGVIEYSFTNADLSKTEITEAIHRTT